MKTLADAYDDLDRAFVKVSLTCRAGDDPAALQRQIRAVCRRCLGGVDVSYPDRSSIEAAEVERPRDYASTALNYLEKTCGEQDDYDELRKRTRQLLKNIDHAS